MINLSRRIKALEYAVPYIPGADDHHSVSVLLELTDEFRAGKRDPIAEAAAKSPDN